MQLGGSRYGLNKNSPETHHHYLKGSEGSLLEEMCHWRFQKPLPMDQDVDLSATSPVP